MTRRTRLIKPSLAKNERLADMGPHAQLLFALLPTLADKEGRLEDRPRRIKAEVFPYYDVDVDAMLDLLASRDALFPGDEPFIIRYEVEGRRYIEIVKFASHQRPHHREDESQIPPPPEVATDEVDHESSMSQACGKHEPSMDEERAVLDPSTLLVTSNKKQATSINKTNRRARSSAEIPIKSVDEFDRFWRAVPNKVGKEAARRAYDRALQRIRGRAGPGGESPHEFLRDRMQAFAESPKGRSDYRPHPATWLNEGRYDDDPATWQRDGRRTTAAASGSTHRYSGD